MISGLKDAVISEFYYYHARYAAWRYSLDFDINCVFDEQLPFDFSRDKHFAKVAMESGKTGLYAVTKTSHNYRTDQADWAFKFIGYYG